MGSLVPGAPASTGIASTSERRAVVYGYGQLTHLSPERGYADLPRRGRSRWDGRGARATLAARAIAERPGSDVVALSNLCVDVVVPLPALPAATDVEGRVALLRQRSDRPPEPETWEVGGNTNFLIAASRIGLSSVSVGHLGRDAFGDFMRRVMVDEEGVQLVPVANSPSGPTDTLVCYVLVDPQGRHAFVSSYDFGPWPLLGTSVQLSTQARDALRHTGAVWINGFTFDELPLQTVLEACQEARGSGASVFFDPGPRCWTMREGPRREALDAVLAVSDGVLVTEEEGEAVTGERDAVSMARALLAGPGSRLEWVVVKQGGRGSTLVTRSSRAVVHRPGFKVPVADTVGCGDSFAAAVVAGFSQRLGEDVTLSLANAVGAATAMGRGAGRQVARAADVETILEEQGGTAADQAALGVLRALAQSGPARARR